VNSRSHGARLILVALALLLASDRADAQRRLTFNPYLFIEQRYTSNVFFQPEGDSDSITRLAVVLPITYDLRRQGTFTASYQFFADRFSTFDELDNEGHQFNVGYSVKPRQASQFRIGGSYYVRDTQGEIGSDLVEDFFLTPPLRREITRVGTRYRHRLSATWGVGFGLTYAEFDFDRILGVEDPDVFTSVQSREGWIFDATVDKRLSERATTGLGYTFQDFTLSPVEGSDQFNMEGYEEIDTLYWFLRYIVGPLWRYDTRLGVFRRDGTGSDGSDLFREGFTGRFTAYRRFSRTELELFAGYAPTSQGLLRGTSTVSAVGVALRDMTPGSWDWRIYTRYAIRDPSVASDPTIETGSLGADVQWHLQRLLTLRGTTLYTNQTSDSGSQDREFLRVTLGLYWFPLGRTQLGGAPTVPFAESFEE
jgi:hypothetical protein